MTPRQRISAVLCIVVIATSTAHAAPDATSAAGAADWLPGIRDSRDLSGPVLVQGRLVDARGRGISGRVTAVAWPPMNVLHALRDGDQVNTVAVGKTQAGPDGTFTIRVDPAIPIAQFREPNGTINFDLRGMGGSHAAVVSFARRLDQSGQKTWVAPEWSAASGPARTLGITLGARTAISELPTAPEPASANKIFPCPDIVRATYNQIWDSVGEVYTGPHATGDFEYINGASSSLGIGFSVSGEFGSFEQSGTASASSTATINYATQAANKRTVFRTTFQYKKFEVWALAGQACFKLGYQVRPTAFQGGIASYTAASTPAASHCSNVLAVPVTLTKQTANAITFTNGLKIGSTIGIDLSTKTGFNASSKIAFRFTSVGKLCGSNAAWPDAARVVGK
jgi:hypothetical protein